MSLKTENSRRVAKSRPVCMGLKAIVIRTDLKLNIEAVQTLIA